MTKAKPVYEDRLLYRQQYTTDDEINVSSTIYAIRWGNSETTSASSRLRITLLYKKEDGNISPVQGLIEQWKGEGWAPVDEFANPDIVFDTKEDYESHMLRMAKSFILGIPVNSEADDFDDPVEPAPRNTLKPKNFPKSLPKSKVSPLKLPKDNLTEEIEVSTKDSHVNEDDSDDDEWL